MTIATDVDRYSDCAIAAENLCSGFTNTSYLQNVNLAVRSGEVLALLGPNGAGKTTTLMTLAGHLRPTAGRVYLKGTPDVRNMEQRARRGVAVVTQDRCVFMGLSVRDNLRLGRGSIDDALELFPELKPHLARQVGLLSGGQQQMLAVGRALAGKPRVLLADEVSLGLAPLIVGRLLEAIAEGARTQGVAVVIVEQHVEQALQFADNACILSRGRVRMAGTAGEIRERAMEVADAYL